MKIFQSPGERLKLIRKDLKLKQSDLTDGKITRNLIGTTDPKKALPGTIRGDYSLSTDKNHVHAADSVTSAEKEIDIFFMPQDIVTYSRADENWI